QSMSRKGNCIDNAPVESFFGIIKQEIYHGEPLCTYEELKSKVEDYIYYYNNQRVKGRLTGMSPLQYRLHTDLIVA
ncbi:IS3 family transposase, partial [Virgibacillus xinjiangensis]